MFMDTWSMIYSMKYIIRHMIYPTGLSIIQSGIYNLHLQIGMEYRQKLEKYGMINNNLKVLKKSNF